MMISISFSVEKYIIVSCYAPTEDDDDTKDSFKRNQSMYSVNSPKQERKYFQTNKWE
jgi:hypothetical protein